MCCCQKNPGADVRFFTDASGSFGPLLRLFKPYVRAVKQVTQLRRPKGRGLWGPSSGYSLRLRFGNSSAWTGPSSALSSCV